jgi:hypothetical protein
MNLQITGVIDPDGPASAHEDSADGRRTQFASFNFANSLGKRVKRSERMRSVQPFDPRALLEFSPSSGHVFCAAQK